MEVETALIINDNISLIANAGTVDADNGEFTLPCDVVDGCLLSGDPLGTIRNLGGGDDSRQPEYSWALSVAYTRQMRSGVFSANTGYKKVGEFLFVNTGAGPDNRLYEGD